VENEELSGLFGEFGACLDLGRREEKIYRLTK
jgi:hypothetical protein